MLVTGSVNSEINYVKKYSAYFVLWLLSKLFGTFMPYDDFLSSVQRLDTLFSDQTFHIILCPLTIH
jgi:hypothetical protein